MATTSPDEVALLKQELAQFLLTEITSVEGATTFRQEVGDQVGAVIDKILSERLAPALETLKREGAEHARQTSATLDDALARLKAATPSDSPEVERKLADIAATLDELRQRVGRFEDSVKALRAAPVATVQPIRTPVKSEERAPESAPLPRWMAWLLLALGIVSVVGLANIYYERLMYPATPVADTVPVFAPPKPQAAAPQVAAPAAAVSVPPQTPAAISPATSPPASSPVTPVPHTTPASAPQPHARIPADFAIERGWLAAQPFAVDPRLARRVGSNEPTPTLKSMVCGRSPSCTSDALIVESSGAKQLIALQMVMSQIGDRFCTPRRSVAVNGTVSSGGLADLATIARCAGGAAPCSETTNKVCPPDTNSIEMDPASSRGALLRWALWKMGST